MKLESLEVLTEETDGDRTSKRAHRELGLKAELPRSKQEGEESEPRARLVDREMKRRIAGRTWRPLILDAARPDPCEPRRFELNNRKLIPSGPRELSDLLVLHAIDNEIAQFVIREGQICEEPKADPKEPCVEEEGCELSLSGRSSFSLCFRPMADIRFVDAQLHLFTHRPPREEGESSVSSSRS